MESMHYLASHERRESLPISPGAYCLGKGLAILFSRLTNFLELDFSNNRERLIQRCEPPSFRPWARIWETLSLATLTRGKHNECKSIGSHATKAPPLISKPSTRNLRDQQSGCGNLTKAKLGTVGALVVDFPLGGATSPCSLCLSLQ